MSRTPYESEGGTRARHGKHARRRKKKKKLLPVLIILVLIVIVAVIGGVSMLINRITPTKERADLEALYGAGEGYASIIRDHEWSDSRALWQNDHAYLDVNMVCDELKTRFYWDEAAQSVLYTLPEETMTITGQTLEDGVPALILQDGTAYLLLDLVKQYANITAETYTDPVRVVLQTEFSGIDTAAVTSDTAVRVLGGIKSPIITDLKAGDEITVLEAMDNWSKVQTSDGWIGYVKNVDLGTAQAVQETAPDNEPEYSSISVDYDICLMCEQSINSSCIDQLKTLIASDGMNSVTTVGPTWFTITAEDGSIASRASSEYMQLAHQNGLTVWALLDNFNGPEVDLTALVSSTESRNRLVQNVMAEVEQYGIDGLNLDIENVPEEAGPGYVQLIREFSVECRKKGVILSSCTYVPSAWTEHYNRKEQGIMVDYLLLMAYDEHYNGSDPGSTASLDFVQQGIVDTCKDMPASKVICGIPFYSRLWKEDLTSVTSTPIGMSSMQEFLDKYQATPVWHDAEGQNYVRVEDGDVIYQLWIEDAESCDARLSLISGYGLAGISCWKQGIQSSDVWPVLAKYYHGTQNG